MKSELCPRPSPMKNAIKLIPEDDHDIVNLGLIARNADPDDCSLKWDNGHLMYCYISVDAMTKVAIMA